jgi:hypothetical protein
MEARCFHPTQYILVGTQGIRRELLVSDHSAEEVPESVKFDQVRGRR